MDFDDTSQEAQMGVSSSYSHEDKILRVVVSALSNDKELVLDLIRKIHGEGELIWKTTKTDTLSSYTKYSKHNEDKGLLQFFEGKLSKSDFEALKMALFIRSEMLKHHNIYEYKKDIRDKFGERGANIANLCSAGYFEQEFRPLYNAVLLEDFKEYYELAVGKKARALFIHSGMSEHEIAEEFSKMVDKALKYHMADFRVHALGIVNVTAIKTFFQTRVADADEKFTVQIKYEKAFPMVATEYIITLHPTGE